MVRQMRYSILYVYSFPLLTCRFVFFPQKASFVVVVRFKKFRYFCELWQNHMPIPYLELAQLISFSTLVQDITFIHVGIASFGVSMACQPVERILNLHWPVTIFNILYHLCHQNILIHIPLRSTWMPLITLLNRAEPRGRGLWHSICGPLQAVTELLIKAFWIQIYNQLGIHLIFSPRTHHVIDNERLHREVLLKSKTLYLWHSLVCQPHTNNPVQKGN